jgi:hypothetical protein
MSIRVICNVCRKEEPPDNSLAPKGWITAWRRGRDMSDHHFCSATCAVAFFTQLEADDAKAAALAAAQTPAAVDDGTLRLQ